MVPAELVATESAHVFYSGSENIVRQYESLLAVIGRVDFVGDDPALAQLFYQAQLDIYLTSLAAYLHATALIGSAGFTPDKYLPYAAEIFDNLSYYLPEAAETLPAANIRATAPAPKPSSTSRCRRPSSRSTTARSRRVTAAPPGAAREGDGARPGSDRRRRCAGAGIGRPRRHGVESNPG
jgi:hypothetical protein